MSKSDSFSKTKSNFGGKGWVILILAFFSILFMSSIAYDSLNVTIEAFAKRFDTNPAIFYIFSTIAAWISVVGAVFWGVVCTKKTIRFAWVTALFLATIVCLIWAYAPNTKVYFFCIAFANIAGMGFAYIAGMNVISNWFPRKKGLAMGWVTIGFPVSAILTVPVMSAILKSGGLFSIYMLYAAGTFILGVLVLIFVRDYPEQAGAYPDNDKNFDKEELERMFKAGLEYQKVSKWQPKKLLQTINAWKIAVSLGIMELLALGIMTNFVPRMIQIGFTEKYIIPMLMVAGIIACFGSYFCGLLDAKVGPKKAILITMLLGLFSLVLNLTGGYLKIAGYDQTALVLMFVAQPFLGVMLGGSANYLVSLTSSVWGRYDFDMAYRVLKPLVAIIGALGITICGGIGQTLGYSEAYIVLAILAFIASIVTTMINDSFVGLKQPVAADLEEFSKI
ncbi:MAG: MFS transporter [Desulfobacteraceae bacterium]|nr:MFS transporter [Desulfobacteraceae bacterium]